MSYFIVSAPVVIQILKKSLSMFDKSIEEVSVLGCKKRKWRFLFQNVRKKILKTASARDYDKSIEDIFAPGHDKHIEAVFVPGYDKRIEIISAPGLDKSIKEDFDKGITLQVFFIIV